MNKSSEAIPRLFEDGRVTVIGLPPSFNILEKLGQADSIRLAMAFCHMSGWEKLEPAVRKCNGSVDLITGLAFFQTEPALLRAWNRLAVSPCFRPRLMISESGIFHPKVLVVSVPTGSFALVGSGNLSEGGLRTNIECFVYTSDGFYLRHLSKWFDALFKQAQDFGEDDIRDYEVKYKNIHRAVSKIHKQQTALELAVRNRHVALLVRWREAINRAKQWFQKPEFRDGWQERKVAVNRMRGLLHYPTFDFSQREWNGFYRVPELGRLIPIYRDRVFRQERRLKEALRLLVDDTKPIRERLSAVLDDQGSHHIPGLRVNTVSKILAIHDPAKWPVYNGPVATTLRNFGYKPPRRVGLAGRYEAFAKLMGDFMKECGGKDVCALDWFFYWSAEKMKHANKPPDFDTVEKVSHPAGFPQRSLSDRKNFFTHAEAFPIIADAIDVYSKSHDDYMKHAEIVEAVIRNPRGRLILERRQDKPKSWSAGVMVAWFSKIFTDGTSAWNNQFERKKIGSAWAYRVMRKAA